MATNKPSARAAAPAEQQRQIDRMQKLAWLLDSSIPVPFTRFSIGVDSLLGLVPGLGDAAGAALSSIVFLQARKLGVPWRTQVHMLGNVLIEWVVGMVPVVGDLFDMGFKANQRNVRLALKAAEKARDKRTRLQRWADASMPYLALLAIVSGAVLSVYLLFRLVTVGA